MLKNVSFSFGQTNKRFFHNESFALYDKALTFLVGKNGAGKSTLFKVLQGLIEAPDSAEGVIEIGAHSYDISFPEDREKLRNKTMLLHQNFDQMLAPSFTGFQNLTFAQFGNYPGVSRVHQYDTVSSLAQQFGIPLDKPVGLLSGGQRQMLALLMTVQKDIDLLLLDEPTSALDAKNCQYMMQGIEKLIHQKNIHVICISHDPDLIDQYGKYKLEVVVDDQGMRKVLLHDQ